MDWTEITCIRTEERNGVISRITHVGGQHPSGQRWTLTEEEAIEEILKNDRQFIVRRWDGIFHVHVGKSKGRRWLRTHWDLAKSDLLLYLPCCPEPDLSHESA